jgi:hypothetical protein
MRTETVVPGKGGRAKFHDQKRMLGSESIYIYICTHILMICVTYDIHIICIVLRIRYSFETFK